MDADQLLAAHFAALARGDPQLAARCLTSDHVNHQAADEPPACALPGVPGFLATSAWLHLAFPDLAFELIEAATQGGHTLAHVWMRATQAGPFVVFPPGGRPVAFPPTGRSFAVRHCHVFRLRDGRHAEHIAVCDDLGMMAQLGHLPPTPQVLARMGRWQLTGSARRAVRRALTVAQDAAAAAPGSAALTVRGAQAP